MKNDKLNQALKDKLDKKQTKKMEEILNENGLMEAYGYFMKVEEENE